MQLQTRSSFEHYYLFPEQKNFGFLLHKETKFSQKFFSVPFLFKKWNARPARTLSTGFETRRISDIGISM